MVTANDAAIRVDLTRARSLLLEQKRALLASVAGIERATANSDAADESQALEEKALRSAFAVGFQLEDRQIRELEEIDRALAKVARQEYGDCERCGCSIAPERLDAVPAARYCLDCERAREREAEAVPAAEAEPSSSDRPVPPDFADLTPAEVVAIVRAELADHTGLEEVVVDWTGERIVLSGQVPSDEIVEIAQQIVGDNLGLTVDNRLRVLPTLREVPGALAPAEAPALDAEEDPLAGSRAPSDERTEAGETGKPFTPPDVPTPEPRSDRNRS